MSPMANMDLHLHSLKEYLILQVSQKGFQIRLKTCIEQLSVSHLKEVSEWMFP